MSTSVLFFFLHKRYCIDPSDEHFMASSYQ